MTDPLRFYSLALEAAKRLKQRSGTLEQMKAGLLRGGAKFKPGYVDGTNPRFNRQTGEYMNPGDQDFWSVDLPPKLMEYLQKEDRVPFFSQGGTV